MINIDVLAAKSIICGNRVTKISNRLMIETGSDNLHHIVSIDDSNRIIRGKQSYSVFNLVGTLGKHLKLSNGISHILIDYNGNTVFSVINGNSLVESCIYNEKQLYLYTKVDLDNAHPITVYMSIVDEYGNYIINGNELKYRWIKKYELPDKRILYNCGSYIYRCSGRCIWADGKKLVFNCDIQGDYNTTPFKEGILFSNTTSSIDMLVDYDGNKITDWKIAALHALKV